MKIQFEVVTAEAVELVCVWLCEARVVEDVAGGDGVRVVEMHLLLQSYIIDLRYNIF